LRTEGGAEGVGRATTSSVVLSIILIFASDFVLARIMFPPK
jgi:phospholipid/cholesterol/gamma-HCH transport system permease protein